MNFTSAKLRIVALAFIAFISTRPAEAVGPAPEYGSGGSAPVSSAPVSQQIQAATDAATAAANAEMLRQQTAAQQAADAAQISADAARKGDWLPATKPAADKCTGDAKKAQALCATMSLMGMDPAAAGMTEMYLEQLASMAATAGKEQGSAAQCKAQQDMNKLMGLINGLKMAACGAAMGSCKKSCKEWGDKAEFEESNSRRMQAYVDAAKAKREQGIADDKVAQCGQYQMNFTMMMMQEMNLAMNMLQNGKCKEANSNQPMPAGSITAMTPDIGYEDQCAKNPDLLFCQCMDPAKAANNPSCPKNGAQNPFLGGGGGVATGGPGTPGMPSAATDLTDDGQLVDSSQAKADRQFGSGGENGGGGGLPGGAAGGAPGNFGGDGGVGPSGIDKNVITGQAGGGGGGSSGGLSPTSGGGGGGGGRGGSESDPSFNLNRFLPKDKFGNRGLAGMSIQAKDGITGPMGPSIWEKVSTQYQNQKTNLYMDK